MTLENQGFLARKGHEGPQEHLVTLGTQAFRVSLARMGLQVPPESQVAMVQRVREDPSAHLACQGSLEIPDPRASRE